MGESKTPSKLQRVKKLSEKELGTLYTYCEAPLILHDALEKEFPHAGQESTTNFDPQIILARIHDILIAQGPDEALLSLALMGWILQDYHDFYYAADLSADHPAKHLFAELHATAQIIIHDLGRLRIDLDAYRTEISDTEIFAHLEKVPDSLCIMASLYHELEDYFKSTGNAPLKSLSRLLAYDAESHADHARNYLDHMRQTQENNEDPAFIPLPYDLQSDAQNADIIDFSLFRK